MIKNNKKLFLNLQNKLQFCIFVKGEMGKIKNEVFIINQKFGFRVRD
jgi:hypothetical protein